MTWWSRRYLEKVNLTLLISRKDKSDDVLECLLMQKRIRQKRIRGRIHFYKTRTSKVCAPFSICFPSTCSIQGWLVQAKQLHTYHWLFVQALQDESSKTVKTKRNYYIIKSFDLQLLILLPLPPKCGITGMHLAFAILGIKPRTSCLLVKHFAS